MSRLKAKAPKELSRTEMEARRLRGVQQQIEYCYRRSEFYRQRFIRAGIKPEDIVTWEDFRRIPVLMTKDDERAGRDESLAQSGHPFGMHLCVPPERIIVSKTTSGTTGLPTFSYSFTRHDVDRWNRLLARALLHPVGLKPGDRALYYFPLSGGGGSSGGFMTGPFAAAGVLTVDVGAEAPLQRSIDLMRLTLPNVLVGSPSQVDMLALKYKETTGEDPARLGFEKLLLSGEPGISIPAVRRKMEQTFSAVWYDFQAPNSEGFCGSCGTPEYQGVHEVAPEQSVCVEDMVDLMTKAPLEIKDGAVGEAVLTSVGREGAPLVKYASGDVYQVFTGPCECGFTGPGYRKCLIGRVDDMLAVGGKLVPAMDIKGIVNSYVPRVTGGMRIVLEGRSMQVEPPLKIKVERAPEISGDSLERLRADLVNDLHGKLGIEAQIQFLEPYALERGMLKTPLFERG